MSTSAPLRTVPLDSKADLNRFIKLPAAILGSDPAWVPPLHLERSLHLGAKTNPYFEHARWKGWLAFRGDQPVGRISAQIDSLHLERYQDATGFFGMLDAEDSQETFAALIGALLKAKPAAAKGKYLRKVTITSTMGPSVQMDTTLAQKLAEKV